jgi:predicted transcriptional regulator
MKPERSHIEVIADILRLGGMGRTEIMYSANTTCYQLQKHLDFLMSRGFMERVDSGQWIGTYRTTRKGRTLLKHIDNLLAVPSSPDLVDSRPLSVGARI